MKRDPQPDFYAATSKNRRSLTRSSAAQTPAAMLSNVAAFVIVLVEFDARGHSIGQDCPCTLAMKTPLNGAPKAQGDANTHPVNMRAVIALSIA